MFQVNDRVILRNDYEGFAAETPGKVISVRETYADGANQFVTVSLDHGPTLGMFDYRLDRVQAKPDSSYTEYVKAKDELISRLGDEADKLVGKALDSLSAWLDKHGPKG